MGITLHVDSYVAEKLHLIFFNHLQGVTFNLRVFLDSQDPYMFPPEQSA